MVTGALLRVDASLSLPPPTVIIALEALIVCRFLLALPRSNSVTCLPYGRSLSLRHVIVVSCPFYYFRCVVLLSLYSPVRLCADPHKGASFFSLFVAAIIIGTQILAQCQSVPNVLKLTWWAEMEN